MSPVRSSSFMRPGFSMIELIFVVIIMSLLTAIALPRVNLHRFRIEAAMRGVQTTFQQSHRAAVMHQHDVIVSFDVSGRRIRVINDINNNGEVDAYERVLWKSLDDGVRFAIPPAGVAGGSAAAVAGSNLVSVAGLPSVIYRRDGSASTDVQAFITSTRPNATDFRAVSVTRSTGRADWYRYTGAGWARGLT